MQRFYKTLDKFTYRQGENQCWPWVGSLTKQGYGQFMVDKRLYIASRVALERKLGRALLPGMKACHACDNPPCCNPAHLFEGDNRANIVDASRKGRMRHQSRERVLEIRRLWESGRAVADIAKQFGISFDVTTRIVKGKSYKTFGRGNSVPRQETETAAAWSAIPGSSSPSNHRELELRE